jgi:hypothetical protein
MQPAFGIPGNKNVPVRPVLHFCGWVPTRDMERWGKLDERKNYACPLPSRHHCHGRVARGHCNVARNGDQQFGFFYLYVAYTSPTFGWILPIQSLLMLPH